MRSDTLFSAILVSALAAVGATAAMTVGTPAANGTARSAGATAPHVVTMPPVMVTGKPATRVASNDAAPETRLQ